MEQSPKNLGHQPLVSVNDYDKVDGKCKGSDAKALSIGRAQWDVNELSLKVWRHGSKRWSPQSEELPLHRNLDLTILLLHVLFDEEPNPDSFLVSSKSQVEENISGGIKKVRDYYNDPANKKYLEPRLKEIRQLLDKMK